MNFFFMVLRLILEKNKIQKDMEHYPFNYYYRVKIKHNKIHINDCYFASYCTMISVGYKNVFVNMHHVQTKNACQVSLKTI